MCSRHDSLDHRSNTFIIDSQLVCRLSLNVIKRSESSYTRENIINHQLYLDVVNHSNSNYVFLPDIFQRSGNSLSFFSTQPFEKFVGFRIFTLPEWEPNKDPD